MEERVTLSLSGGKDSLALALRLAELRVHVDLVIFALVGWEFPETLATIEDARWTLPYEFITLDLRDKFHYMFYDYRVTRGKNKGKRMGFPGKRMLWCSREKGRDIDRYIKSRYKDHIQSGGRIVTLIGFAADEAHRSTRSELTKTPAYLDRRFPLIEWGWPEERCLGYCFGRGFDFSGYYERFKRTGCFCCPTQPLSALRTLYGDYPELWQRLREMQEHSHIPFRADGKTVFDLEERFRSEGGEDDESN